MKLILIGLLMLLASCASTSKLAEIEQKVQEGQTTITELDQKIAILEEDKQKLEKQLQFIDGEGDSEAIGIRRKIAAIDETIGSYNSEITSIKTFLSENSDKIATVENQQSKQRSAVSEAIKKNEQLKMEAADEIRALEKEYEERRRKTEDPDDPKQEN